MANQAKLPVIDTITESLGFAAKRYLTVLKVLFLPGLLLLAPMTLVSLYFLGGLVEELTAMATTMDPEVGPDPERVTEIMATLAPFYALMALMLPLQLLFRAMVDVPLMRAIVLEERPGLIRLDGLVWRYFFGQIVFFLLMMGVGIGIFVPTGIAAGILSSAGEEAGWARAATVVLFVAAALLMFFVTIRLSLFMVEVAVTGKYGVRSIFARTKGNVLRIVGAAILFLVLVMVIGMISQGIFGAAAAMALLPSITDLKDAGEAAGVAGVLDVLKGILFSPVGGTIILLWALFTVFLEGLGISFNSHLYRNLG